MKILLVEDDKNLSEDIKSQLQGVGFTVEALYDGFLAERIAGRQSFDCMVIDVNIPGKNGFELCKSLRSQNIRTPIIMLTAFGEIEDKMEGFAAGADDYLTKPFYFQELLARIRLLMKRLNNFEEEKNLVVEDLIIDMNKKQVSRAGELIKFTPREFELLVMLASAKGNPVSKKDLISKVWGTSLDVNTNTIEVFINLIRNKIDKAYPVKLIHTKLGFGYYLSAEKHEA